MDTDNEWNIVNVVDIKGTLVDRRTVSRTKRMSSGSVALPPSWVYEDSSSPGQFTNIGTKKPCAGDFCGLPGGGKADVLVDDSMTVTGRSLLKARAEMGVSLPSTSFRPAKMNQIHKVCKACHDKYVEMDQKRMNRAKIKLEQDTKEAEALAEKKNKKEKGWKSRMQIEYEAKLEVEREKVRQLLLKKKQAKYKLDKASTARQLGISLGELSDGDTSTSSSEGEQATVRSRLKIVRKKLDGDESDESSTDDEGDRLQELKKKQELHEIRKAEKAEKSKILEIQNKVLVMRRVTNAFAADHSPSKLRQRAMAKAREAKKSLKKRRQTMAVQGSTFSKVMLMLKNKRALEGAGVIHGRIPEGEEEDEDEDEDEEAGVDVTIEEGEEGEEDDEVGEAIRNSIILRAAMGRGTVAALGDAAN